MTLQLLCSDVCLAGVVCLVLFCLIFIFFGGLQGQRVDTKEQGGEWDWGV